MTTPSPTHRRRHRKHWYHATHYICDICGDIEVVRERRHGRRPKRWNNRNEFRDNYHCASLDIL